jgi:acetyl-CoA acetyltransferase
MAQVSGVYSADELLNAPYDVSPLRAHDCPPVSDGAAAVVLAAGDLARSVCERPAWITGIDHRVEAHSLGARDLAKSASAALAAEKAGVGRGQVDVAELHAPFSHQELILRDALGLTDAVDINPSGGTLAANPIMAAGLIRIGEAASRVMNGSAQRTVAHATSGPCLQQNLVCVLEAR